VFVTRVIKQGTYPPTAPNPRKQKAKARATRAKGKGERDIREKVQAGAAKREVGSARRDVGAARREEKQRAREKAMKAPVGIVFRLATSLSSVSSKVSRECRTSRRRRRWVLQARTSCIRPLPFHSMAISSRQSRPHRCSRHSRIWDPIQDLFTYPMGGCGKTYVRRIRPCRQHPSGRSLDAGRGRQRASAKY